MDILYHGIVGAGISKALTGEYSPVSILSAVLPDVIGTLPYVLLKAHKADKKTPIGFIRSFFASASTNTFDQRIDKIMYRATHSLFSVALFGFIMFVCTPASWLIHTLSYLSHILIDIPTHEGELATRILYPVSNYHIQARSWSGSFRSFVGFWTFLIVILWYF